MKCICVCLCFHGIFFSCEKRFSYKKFSDLNATHRTKPSFPSPNISDRLIKQWDMTECEVCCINSYLVH